MKNEKKQFKKYLLNFLPFLFIFGIWVIFAYPYFLQNKVPYSATYQNNNFAPWDAYPNLSGPVKNNAMPDVTTQIIPWKHFTTEIYRYGQIPFWNPNSFSGSPHLANYQSAVLSPLNLLFIFIPFIDAWSLLILLQPLLAGILMYLFVRSLQISKLGGLFCAISFMYCGFIIVWMDYGTLAYAILFLPIALFAIEKFHKTKNIRYLYLLSFSIPLSFFSGHFQISNYFLLTIIIWIIYKYLQTKNIANSLYILLYMFFGILLTLPQVLPSIEFYTQSLRSNIFQKGEAIPWGYLPTFLAPDFFGNPVTRNDWFGHYAEWNAYIGILPFMLAFYALIKKKFQTYFLFIFAMIIFLLAFQTPFIDLLINLHIPVLSTSAASRIIVLFSFCFITLAGFGFDAFLDDFGKKNIKKIIIWFISFSIVFLILWLIILSKSLMPKDKIIIAKQNLILPSALFGIGEIIVIVGLLIKKRISNNKASVIIGVILLLITAFDMLRFATKWQAFDRKKLAFVDVPVTKYLQKISGYERVIGNFGAEASTYYNLPSLGGYDALYIRRYGEFIASLDRGRIKDAERSVVTFPIVGKYTSKAINLLNVGYIVHKVSDDNRGWTFPYWQYPIGQFQKIFEDGSYRVYKNTAVFPRVYLVSNYTVKKDSQEIFSTMFSDNFNLLNRVVLEKNPGIKLKEFINSGLVKITKYSSDMVDIITNLRSNGILFLSDPYYPGWKAFIDGKQSEILRADYAFRAIKVPSGKHRIEFVYQSESFIIGVYFAIIGLIGMLAITFYLRIFPLNKEDS